MRAFTHLGKKASTNFMNQPTKEKQSISQPSTHSIDPINPTIHQVASNTPNTNPSKQIKRSKKKPRPSHGHITVFIKRDSSHHITHHITHVNICTYHIHEHLDIVIFSRARPVAMWLQSTHAGVQCCCTPTHANG